MSDSTPAPVRERRRLLPSQPYVLGLAAFARRLPALLSVLLFLAIAWLDFGSGLNIPALFWDEPGQPGKPSEGRWVYGLLNGLSVTLLFAYVWLVTYVLDATFDKDTLAGGPQDHGWVTFLAFRTFPIRNPNPDPAAARLRAYLGVTFLPCVLLLAAATEFRVDGRSPYLHLYPDDPFSPDPQPLVMTRWPVLVGILVGLVVLRLLHLAGGRLFERWSGLVHRFNILARITRSDDRWVRAVVEGLFAFQAVVFLVCVLSVWKGWLYPPPVTAVCMLLGVLVGLNGLVWYQARRVALLGFAVLLVWVYWVNTTPYKLRFPELDYVKKEELRNFEAPAWTLEAIRSDTQRQKEWERVIWLTGRRIDGLEAGKSFRDRLDAFPKTHTVDSYSELLQLYSEVLDQAVADEEAALVRWRNAAPPARAPLHGTGKPKLVVVTVTGGANRSALWTAKVLSALDKALPNFPKHVRLITGASGGMVGAAYYSGSVTKEGKLPDDFDPEDVAQNHIVPIMSQLVFREVPFLAIPTDHYTHDRGHALDLSLEGKGPHLPPAGRRLGRAFDRTFHSLKEGEDDGWRPPLVFTPMMIEDGRRLFISNRHLHYLTTSTGNILLPELQPADQTGATTNRSPGVALGQQRGIKQAVPAYAPDVPDRPLASPQERNARKRSGTLDVYGLSGIEFFHLFPYARDKFRVSTAARMNATFPFLSPAVDLPTIPTRRVVDAGFYDNYGVATAAAWLRFWQVWLDQNVSGVLIIQIRDSASHHDRRYLTRARELRREGLDDPDDNPTSNAPNGTEQDRELAGASPLAWFTGPLAAVDKARQSTSSFRNDELLAALDDYFKRRNRTLPDPQFFETVVFERYSNVGMSWYLNSEDRRQIIDSWSEQLPNGIRNFNPDSLALLKQWWDTH